MSEYIRISSPELVYGETNLLQSEISLLTMVQQYKEYETLRKEELLLKIELKKKISEVKEALSMLAKALPESKFEEEQDKKERMKLEMISKIDSAVEKAKKKEWQYWKEKKQRMQVKPVRIQKREEPKEEPKKTPIEAELEAIQKRLAKLQ